MAWLNKNMESHVLIRQSNNKRRGEQAESWLPAYLGGQCVANVSHVCITNKALLRVTAKRTNITVVVILGL